MREILEIHTMQINSDFNEAMTECIRSGCSRQLPPVEIFEQINAILLRFDKIVADAGWTGDLALDTHKDFVAIYSEMVVSIACYESQIADAEIALIEHLKASSTQCLNEESMAEGANSERKQAHSEALASLYRRGLLKRDARTGLRRQEPPGLHDDLGIAEDDGARLRRR